jgi:hypothetical protein
MRRIELDGNHARVFVIPWQGRLSVEATLEGGRVVVREALADPSGDGPIALLLTAPSPKASVSAAPAAPLVRPRGGDAELHSNPYGP